MGKNISSELYDDFDKFFGKYRFHLISPLSRFLLALGFIMAVTAKPLSQPISPIPLISFVIGIGILLTYKTWRPERAIHESALRGDIRKIENCLKSGLDINIKDVFGITALHCAAKGGHLETGEFLIDNGSDINSNINSQGGPPLSWAILFKQDKFVALLIARGATINISDAKQRTPLHMAAWSGNLYAVQYLVKHDSELNSRMFNHKTPLTLAKEKGHREIIEFLQQQGATE